jgi:NADH dehydrogenase
VVAVWATGALFGRDVVSLAAVQHPREAFVAAAPAPRATTARPAERPAEVDTAAPTGPRPAPEPVRAA